MNGRTIARILLVIVLVGGAISLGVGAYNAGVSAGLAQTGQVVVTPAGVPVAPVAPYVGYGWGYGWGFGHGFGFFGFLGTILVFFLFIGLLRAAFGGSRRGSGGPGGPGGWRSDWHRDAWQERVRQTHDELHRQDADPSKRPDADTN